MEVEHGPERKSEFLYEQAVFHFHDMICFLIYGLDLSKHNAFH